MAADPEMGSLKFSSQDQVHHRLATPLIQTFLDTENISFQRSKCGLFGWGGDKVEEVSGMECKVFAANNVEIVTRTRTEHMSQAEIQTGFSWMDFFIFWNLFLFWSCIIFSINHPNQENPVSISGRRKTKREQRPTRTLFYHSLVLVKQNQTHPQSLTHQKLAPTWSQQSANSHSQVIWLQRRRL